MTGMTGMTRMARRRHLVVRSGRMGTRRTVHGAGRNEQGQHKQPHAPEFAFHGSRHFYSIQIYSFLRDRKIPPGHCPPRTARRPRSRTCRPYGFGCRHREQTPGADAKRQRQNMKTSNAELQMSGRTETTRCTAACSGSFRMEGSPAREAERGPSDLTQRRQMTLKSQ